MQRLCLSALLVWASLTDAQAGTTPTTSLHPCRGPQAVVVPPLIIREPAKMIAFREYERTELACVATGQPNPVYRWQFNDAPFDPSSLDGRVFIRPGEGTLVFVRPIARDAGTYQCFAENAGGIAASVKVYFIWAFLEPFQSRSVFTHRPLVGTSLTLKCTQPRSYPKPEIFWATVAQGETFKPIDLTDRVTTDPETGSLYFANVVSDDRQFGRTYACVVHNKVVRSYQQGDYQRIEPQGDTPRTMPPGIMWQSPAHQVALRDQTWRIKCIFSGRPTPRVDWARLDGKPMPNRARQESFGQELVIEKLQLDDAGRYECQGINDAASMPTRRLLQLTVEAAPSWIQRPQNVDATDGDNVEFHCQADGLPAPTIKWYINGTPISEMASNPRVLLQDSRLILLNVSLDDTQVVQCNASNKHDYAYANAYLRVHCEEAPSIRELPGDVYRVAQGQEILLPCTADGAPSPQVSWSKDGGPVEDASRGRVVTQPDGHLLVKAAEREDAGTYTCTAINRLGQDTQNKTLRVLDATTITHRPEDQRIEEGQQATFYCGVKVDPAEARHLVVDWLRNNKTIDFRLASRYSKRTQDDSLTIHAAIVQDSGTFTCLATTRLDKVRASAQLLVQGVPDPPHQVRVERFERDTRTVRLSWRAGRDNNAPIQTFTVQYNSSFAPFQWQNFPPKDGSHIFGNEGNAEFVLSPWGNYTFRVLAHNRVGTSEPSLHTKNLVTTDAARPDANPGAVIAEGSRPDNLIIYWRPMSQLEQNAPGFYYKVSWRRQDVTTDPWRTAVVTDWKIHKFVVPGSQPTFKPYLVKVEAGNNIGMATSKAPEVLGYSGEDAPLLYPEDILVLNSSITATSALLAWPQIDTSPSVVRGHFRGYRVRFWTKGQHQRYQDFILQEPPTPYFPDFMRMKRDLPAEVVVKLENLWPFSTITFVVQVLNKYYVGPASQQNIFTTKEGRPGPPASLTVTEVSATHVSLAWSAPSEPNGILTGYRVSYQQVHGLMLDKLQLAAVILDPQEQSTNVTGLQPERRYRFNVHALTAAGIGDPIYVERGTAEPPRITSKPPTVDNKNVTASSYEKVATSTPSSALFVGDKKRNSTARVRALTSQTLFAIIVAVAFICDNAVDPRAT